MWRNNDDETYERHFVIPSSVSLRLHLSELMRVGGLDDDAVSSPELIVAGSQPRFTWQRQPAQPLHQSLCQIYTNSVISLLCIFIFSL